MKLSVIIPTFNRAGLLPFALDSVLPQFDSQCEAIVVDDGSTDATADALASYRDRVSTFTQPNAGPGPARNFGARHARGEFLAFLDADDAWLPWTLRHLRALLDEPSPPSLISSMPVSFSDPGTIAAARESPPVVERYPDYLAADPVTIFPGAGTMVVRREAFLRAGGFSATRMGAEDAELYLRLGVEPGFVFVRAPALVAYRLHPGSLSTDVAAGLRGRWAMLASERRGDYPGGRARRRDRLAIITSHGRSGTIVALRAGRIAEASRLYAAMLPWHLRLGRWRYLAGFPLMAARAFLRGPDRRAGQGFLPGPPGLPTANPPPNPAPAAAPSTLTAAVVLATRNRKDELRRALQSCLDQTVPVQIVVRDDGSTDGTEAMVRAEFPMVDYARHETARGSIPSRNEAVAAAHADIIISIDDDAALVSPRTIEQTLADFDHPRVGIVAIPFIDVLKGSLVEQAAPIPDGHFVLDTYRGCAAAWRRDAFTAVGGYEPVLVHMAEEPDLALRFLDRGLIVRAGRADPVHHFESPNRNRDTIWFQIARNGVLQGWLSAPWWMLPLHLAGTLLSSIRTGLRVGKLRVLLRGVAAGIAAIRSPLARRRPVSPRAYFICRWLRRHKPARLDDLADRLPPLRA